MIVEQVWSHASFVLDSSSSWSICSYVFFKGFKLILGNVMCCFLWHKHFVIVIINTPHYMHVTSFISQWRSYKNAATFSIRWCQQCQQAVYMYMNFCCTKCAVWIGCCNNNTKRTLTQTLLIVILQKLIPHGGSGRVANQQFSRFGNLKLILEKKNWFCTWTKIGWGLPHSYTTLLSRKGVWWRNHVYKHYKSRPEKYDKVVGKFDDQFQVYKNEISKWVFYNVRKQCEGETAEE